MWSDGSPYRSRQHVHGPQHLGPVARFVASTSDILDPGAIGLGIGAFTDMATFQDFLTQLLDQGQIVFRSAKAPHDGPTEHDVAILAEAFDTFALSVAGPRIAFDPRTACEAAELVRQSGWALVQRDDRLADLKRRLKMAGPPRTASQHLSADLMLRFLPQVIKRARGLDPSDPLTGLLGDVLRCWPLSGVLSDVEEGPLLSLDFDGHPGLLLLYAERLTQNDRPSWRPERSSPAWEYYELVLQQRSTPMTVRNSAEGDPMEIPGSTPPESNRSSSHY